MLRAMGDGGWWLIRHPDHARLAGEFAARWGNETFRPPHPHADVIEGIGSHDDGWSERDQAPLLTREGKPSAFGVDLVGKYTAFEEIDLSDYLAVRGRALEVVAERNPYAAILISMHTCNLLTEHADRSTIQPERLPLLDGFIAWQRLRQLELRAACADTGRYADLDLMLDTLTEHFRLLQACDNLSLLACVDFEGPATLLHPLPLRDGRTSTVNVMRMGPRRFRLDPWPFDSGRLEFEIPGRWVEGVVFDRVEEIRERYAAAGTQWIRVELVSAAA
jgi:hypothetical protein